MWPSLNAQYKWSKAAGLKKIKNFVNRSTLSWLMLQLKTTCACNVSVPSFSQNLSLKKNKNYDYACIHYEVNHAQVRSPKSEVRSPKSELWTLQSEVWSLKSEVWSLKSELWTLNSEVWTLKSEVCGMFPKFIAKEKKKEKKPNFHFLSLQGTNPFDFTRPIKAP